MKVSELLETLDKDGIIARAIFEKGGMMQIIIDIPKEDYIRLRDEGMFGNVTTFKRAVREGIPLPKGHGRLIDVERLYDDFESMDYDFEDAIEYAPTIIEADRAESEDQE